MAILSHNILVDLDCLLDTRLSTLHAMDPSLPIKILNDGYYERLSDQMENVLNKEQRLEYIKRIENRADNPKTLKYALPTNMNIYLKDFYNGYTADQIVNSSNDRSTCFINIYPYYLEDKQIALVKNLLIKDLYGYCNVDVVRIDTSKINIEQMVQAYQEYVTYYSSGFLNNWFTNFDDIVAPGFKVILPKLGVGDKSWLGVKDDEEIDRETLYECFESVRTSFSGVMYLGFLSPRYYCPRNSSQQASSDNQQQ